MTFAAPPPSTEPPPDEATPADELADDPASPTPAPRPTRKGRLARLVLLGGALLAGSQLLPHLPHERPLVLRLDDPATVTSIDLAWTRAGRDEPVVGSSWRFEAGRAPRRLESTVRLANGSYEVEIVVQRADGPRASSRLVALDGSDEVTIIVPR